LQSGKQLLLFFINIKEESLGYNGVGFHLTDGRRETRESVTENKPPFFFGKGEKAR